MATNSKTKNKDLISIIIPYYKTENQIVRCLDSVISQTYDNLEIICVCSSDEDSTKNIVKKYLKKYDNMIGVEQSGRGLGDARNRGLEIANGKYIIFLDGDDYIESNAIELMYDKIKKDKSDIACCGFKRIDDITKKVYSHEMISMKYDLLKITSKNINEISFISPSAWGKLFKRDLIIKEKFNSDILGEDLLFFMQIIPKVRQISFVKKELWNYVIRYDSLTFLINIDKVNQLEKSLSDCRNNYLKHNLDISYLKMLDITAFMHLGINMPLRLSYSNGSKEYVKYIKKQLNNTFVYWNKAKITINNKSIFKTIMLNIIRISYQLNVFMLFIYLYNFMVKYLKKEIRW